MATTTIPAQTVIDDDFTGKRLTSEDSPVKLEITLTLDGKPFGKPASVDTARAMADILARFLSDPSDENRRELGARIPRPGVTRGSGSGGSASNTDNGHIRAWANTEDGRKYGAANGLTVPEIGKAGRMSPKWESGWKSAGEPKAA
jgi:hypothetical protein